MSTVEVREGWYEDPAGRHDYRWFSVGRPTDLVKDGAAVSRDALSMDDAALFADMDLEEPPGGALPYRHQDPFREPTPHRYQYDFAWGQRIDLDAVQASTRWRYGVPGVLELTLIALFALGGAVLLAIYPLVGLAGLLCALGVTIAGRMWRVHRVRSYRSTDEPRR